MNKNEISRIHKLLSLVRKELEDDQSVDLDLQEYDQMASPVEIHASFEEQKKSMMKLASELSEAIEQSDREYQEEKQKLARLIQNKSDEYSR